MPFSAEVLSTAAVVAAAIVFIALERRFPYDRGQAFFREGFWTDLALYTLVQSYILGLLIAAFIGWLDRLTDPSHPGWLSGWPLWAQVLFFLVTHDLYIYWFHRLQHRSPWLWRIHEAHHSGTSVDWLSGSRSHPFEILINQTIEFAPIVLLGAAPVVATIKVTIDAIWGMYIHSNIGVRSGRLQYVLNGPEMHRWHHAAELAPGDNFATKLAVWDWIFGTAHRPSIAGARPRGYGLAGAVSFPGGYLAQLVRAFRA